MVGRYGIWPLARPLEAPTPFLARGSGADAAGDADVADDEPWDVWSAIFIPLWAAVGGDTYESVVAGSPTVGMGLLWIYVLLAQARPALVAISAQSPTRYRNATSRRSAAI